MADVPLYGCIVAFSFHVPMNYLFIYIFGWGYLGAAGAVLWFSLTQCVATIVCAVGTPAKRARLQEHAGTPSSVGISLREDVQRAVSSISGIRQYLGLAIPGVVLISEWWASETVIFMAGMLSSSAVSLGAMSIFQGINGFFYMIQKGLSIAIAKRVGTALGEQNAAGARYSSLVGVSTAVLIGLACSAVLCVTPQDYFPSFFTTDESVVLEAAKTIPYAALYVFADGVAASFDGVIKGCGRQCVVMPVVLFAYWVVGVPLAYLITFCWGSGDASVKNVLFHRVTGLVAGTTFATCLHMVLFAILVGCFTDWRKESEKAQARLSVERHVEETNSLVKSMYKKHYGTCDVDEV